MLSLPPMHALPSSTFWSVPAVLAASLAWLPPSSLSVALALVPPSVAPAFCVAVLLLPLSVGAPGSPLCAPSPVAPACPPPPPPPHEDFTSPHNVDCPARGGLVAALLPTPWRAPPTARGTAPALVVFAGTSWREGGGWQLIADRLQKSSSGLLRGAGGESSLVLIKTSVFGLVCHESPFSRTPPPPAPPPPSGGSNDTPPSAEPDFPLPLNVMHMMTCSSEPDIEDPTSPAPSCRNPCTL